LPNARRPPLLLILRVGLTVVFVAGAAYSLQGGWYQIADYSWQLDPPLVILATVLFVGATLLGNMIWLLLMRSFGAHIALRPALRVYCTSNLGKYLPGKVWHVFARIYLAQQYGAPVARATTGSITDVLIFVAAGCVVSVLALPTVIGWSIEMPILVGLMLGSAAGIGAMLHPVVLNSVFALGGRFVPRFRDVRLEVGYIAILRIFALDLLLWGVICGGVFATVHAVAPVSIAHAPTLAAIYAVSYTSGLIMPLAPAGLGVREGATIFFLAPLVGAPAAIVSTALIRVLQVLAESLCAAAFSRL
ncbi:MAG: lysylphosphatidylglycerol synthase domain-containing protein, partial [Chloroflexota bacterium]